MIYSAVVLILNYHPTFLGCQFNINTAAEYYDRVVAIVIAATDCSDDLTVYSALFARDSIYSSFMRY